MAFKVQLLYAVGHAKHKNSAKHQPSLINIELRRSSTDIEVSDTTTAVSMSTVTLPKSLSRPFFCEIAQEITPVTPELADRELNYICEGI